jgi:hypothetical protein
MSQGYARTMRRTMSGPSKLRAPNPDSPFYVPPPSTKALRWSIPLCLFGPLLLAFCAFEFALSHEWVGLAFALGVLIVYGGLEGSGST